LWFYRCWVGKRHLEEAIKTFSGDVSFEVNWRPFFLNPATPDEGIPVLEYLGRKYGPQAAASAQSGKGPLSQMAEKMVSLVNS
jgi:predicted DsbA family dithiol-disulfide isomerase